MWLDALPAHSLELYAPQLRSLHLLWTFSRQLATHSAYVPQLLRIGLKHYTVRWLPALLNPIIRESAESVRAVTAEDMLFYKVGKEIYEPIEGDAFSAIASFFISHLVRTYHNLDARILQSQITQLFFNTSLEHFLDFETKEYPVAMQLWLNRFFIVEKN